MKQTVLISAFIFCLIGGCTCESPKTKALQTGDVLTLRFDFNEEPVNIHDIGLIYDMEILNLDCKEAIFGIVDKIIKYKTRIYLMDNHQTYSVIIYDTLGNFVNLIDKHGQGPKEYIQLNDIFINREDETLNLLSRSDRKILKCDLDGNILSVGKMPKIFSNMLKIKDGYLGYMGNDISNIEYPYNLWTLSNDMNVKEYFSEIDPTWNSIDLGSRTIFSSYSDITYYIRPLDFDIYSLKDGVFSTAYTYDFGKWTWPKAYREWDKYKDLLENGDGRMSYITGIDHFQETQNHLIADVIHQFQRKLCVYNKLTKKACIAMPDVYTDKYFCSFGRIIGFDETAIYSLVDAPDMKELWTGKDEYNDFESQYPEQIKRLREKFPHIDEEGNPFLIIHYIR
jgi:hypothetical protein